MPTNSNLTAKAAMARAITSSDSYTTTLILLLVDTYGTECFTWDPQTILLELQDDFDVTVPQATLDKVMAGINIITADDFYQSVPDFITTCNILSGDTYDPRAWDPADVDEIAWGITEALLLSPPEDEEPFSPEVQAYIGATLDAAGIITPPDILRIAVRDREPATEIAADYSDDPIMFNSIYDLEMTKSNAILAMLKENLRELAAQLEHLPLNNGSTRGAIEQMLRSFGADQPLDTVI